MVNLGGLLLAFSHLPERLLKKKPLDYQRVLVYNKANLIIWCDYFLVCINNGRGDA